MSEKIVSLRAKRGVSVPAEQLKFKIATSDGSLGRVTMKATTWPLLRERLSKPVVDQITTKAFKAKPIAFQHKAKNKGYFVGGAFKSGARKIAGMTERSLLTFDIDNCSIPMFADIEMGMSAFGDFEYFFYTTRSHTPEAPRVRLVMPLAEPISVAKLAPLTRIMAQRLDPEMQTVDPVSFRPAQVMYYPNVNSDSEFICGHNPGTVLDGEATLNEWGDWSDYALLPRSAREKPLRAAGDKATDPVTKRGIVGAVCRAYSITAAIDEFLSDIYEVGEGGTEGNPRYSYLPGSTRNGAVIYDDDKFLYSNHGTDPCADQLVNTFDMLRLHKFGDQDKPNEEDEDEIPDPTSLKSYKAMTEWAQELPTVARELREDNYDVDAIANDSFEADELDAMDDAEVEPEDFGEEIDEVGEQVVVRPEVTSTEADPDWRENLAVTDKGIIRCTVHNLILILDNDPRFRGRLAYNQFLQEAVIIHRIKSKQWGHDTGPVLNRENGDFIAQNVEVTIRAILEAPRGEGKSGYGMRVPDRDLKDSIYRSASNHPFHPIRSYLNACQWDGVPRLQRFFTTYAQAEDSAYHRMVAYNFIVAGVARAFEPGMKFDFVTILEGIQGIGKSTLIATLAGHSRFGELRNDFEKTEKLVEQIQGKWIVEIPELAQFKRADVETLKAIFSAQKDRTRLAWGRGAQDYHRQVVFAGTTNGKLYLKDKENRRFWPVKIPPFPIDPNPIIRDRDQIWAEAREEYLYLRRTTPAHLPLPLYLRDPEVAKVHAALARARTEVTSDDTLQGQIEAWLEQPVPASQVEAGFRPDGEEDTEGEPLVKRDCICLKDITFYVQGRPDHENDKGASMSLARIMSEIAGWHRAEKKRLKGKLGPQTVYRRDKK